MQEIEKTIVDKNESEVLDTSSTSISVTFANVANFPSEAQISLVTLKPPCLERQYTYIEGIKVDSQEQLTTTINKAKGRYYKCDDVFVSLPEMFSECVESALELISKDANETWDMRELLSELPSDLPAQ